MTQAAVVQRKVNISAPRDATLRVPLKQVVTEQALGGHERSTSRAFNHEEHEEKMSDSSPSCSSCPSWLTLFAFPGAPEVRAAPTTGRQAFRASHALTDPRDRDRPGFPRRRDGAPAPGSHASRSEMRSGHPHEAPGTTAMAGHPAIHARASRPVVRAPAGPPVRRFRHSSQRAHAESTQSRLGSPRDRQGSSDGLLP